MILQFAPEPSVRGDTLRAMLKTLCSAPMPLMPEDFDSAAEAGESRPITARLTGAQRLAKERSEKQDRRRMRERLRPPGCLTTAEVATRCGTAPTYVTRRCSRLCVVAVKVQSNLTFWRIADLQRVGILP